MEKIISISEEGFGSKSANGRWDTEYDGYVIKTDDQTIKVGVSSFASCCENFGYVTSEDDLSNFVGAEFLGIKVTDTALRTYSEEELPTWDCSTMFVDIETSKGVFQIVCYNSHNGYYGHDAVVISRDVNESEYL